MISVSVSNELRDKWPAFVGAALFADIKNSTDSDGLWKEINEQISFLQTHYDIESIKHISGIEATRKAYKACGKDPSRYRPSNEQLIRRIIQNKGLYHVNSVVDMLNLASMKFGYSIGGFDSCLIKGDKAVLGVGRKDEPYEGIGRGILNIEGMPVYRDDEGGFATPTSDHERTKISIDTKNLLVFVNGYDGDENNVMLCANFIERLLRLYAFAKDVQIRQF